MRHLPLPVTTSLFAALGGRAILAAVLALSGCSTPQAWVVFAPESDAHALSEPSVAEPFATVVDQMLARMLGAGFVAEASEPISMAMQQFELFDPDRPADLPSGDAVRARVRDALEAADAIALVHASPIPETPVLLGSGDPPRMTLGLEIFRLTDVPRVPERAFYLIRLWVFDLESRETVWEALSDPIAWPVVVKDPSDAG